VALEEGDVRLFVVISRNFPGGTEKRDQTRISSAGLLTNV